jgi:hypothetical protein
MGPRVEIIALWGGFGRVQGVRTAPRLSTLAARSDKLKVSLPASEMYPSAFRPLFLSFLQSWFREQSTKTIYERRG